MYHCHSNIAHVHAMDECNTTTTTTTLTVDTKTPPSAPSVKKTAVTTPTSVVGKLGIKRHLSLTRTRGSTDANDIHVNANRRRSSDPKKVEKKNNDEACRDCGKTFGIFRFKHACENCDRIVCKACLNVVTNTETSPTWKTAKVCGECEDAFLDEKVFSPQTRKTDEDDGIAHPPSLDVGTPLATSKKTDDGNTTHADVSTPLATPTKEPTEEPTKEPSKEPTEKPTTSTIRPEPLMSPIRPELSPRRHVWFGAKRCAEFARCLDAYRSPIELPYAFIRQSELRFNVHKKRFFALSRSFKRVVRSASESELSRSLDLLMEKWTSLYKHHRDEILEEDARSRKRSESPSHAPRVVAGDFQDMLKIVNAQSQHERKTVRTLVVVVVVVALLSCTRTRVA